MQADTRTIPEERAEFEEFASGKLNLQLMDNGIYFNGLTQCCWEAWKAARSTVRAPVDAPSVAHIEVHDGGAIEYGLTKDAHRLPPGIYRLYAIDSLQQHDQQEGAA